jgi:hypothetical protein
VAARAAAFADPEVIQLASEYFIPLAENCSPLQTQQDAKGEFFRLVAEQGHYGGRTIPSATRQGQYAFTADGQLLSSINTRDAERTQGMMLQALERWRELATDRAAARPADLAPYERDLRYPDLYPAGGLVLKQTLRDLPRAFDAPIPQVRPEAINFDYAWFTKDDAALFLPEKLEVGQRKDLPRRLVRRLARFHLLDSVRGETPAWRDEHVTHAHLTTEVTRVDGPRVHLTLRGTVLNQQAGTWAVRPFRQKWDHLTRGYDCALYGELTYDTSTERFTQFDLLATGDRWGGTEHNNRQEDQLTAPMGIAFHLAGAAPADRTPPHANLWDYFELRRPDGAPTPPPATSP